MTILELQKELQEMYEKCGDVEVAIQNGDDGGERIFRGGKEILKM
jgi:hypothetical protein